MGGGGREGWPAGGRPHCPRPPNPPGDVRGDGKQMLGEERKKKMSRVGGMKEGGFILGRKRSKSEWGRRKGDGAKAPRGNKRGGGGKEEEGFCLSEKEKEKGREGEGFLASACFCAVCRLLHSRKSAAAADQTTLPSSRGIEEVEEKRMGFSGRRRRRSDRGLTLATERCVWSSAARKGGGGGRETTKACVPKVSFPVRPSHISNQ